MKSISARDAQEKQQNNELIIIDVRTPKEHAEGHIPDSKNIDIKSSEFEKTMNSLDKEASYAVHCNSGGRGKRAAKYMRENGFKHAKSLEGGIVKWTEHNLPIE